MPDRSAVAQRSLLRDLRGRRAHRGDDADGAARRQLRLPRELQERRAPRLRSVCPPQPVRAPAWRRPGPARGPGSIPPAHRGADAVHRANRACGEAGRRERKLSRHRRAHRLRRPRRQVNRAHPHHHRAWRSRAPHRRSAASRSRLEACSGGLGWLRKKAGENRGSDPPWGPKADLLSCQRALSRSTWGARDLGSVAAHRQAAGGSRAGCGARQGFLG